MHWAAVAYVSLFQLIENKEMHLEKLVSDKQVKYAWRLLEKTRLTFFSKLKTIPG